MNAALLVSAILLSTVFAVAGAGKLADLSGSRSAVRGFGVPERLAGWVGLVLPFLELALAILILPNSTRRAAGMGVLALLLVFCVAIGVGMARGKHLNCHCFGQLHSAPVGWRTLARNGALIGLALVVVGVGRDDAGPSVFAWTSRLDASHWTLIGLAIVALVTFALAALAVVHILSAYGRLLVRLERVEDRLRASGIELDDFEEAPQLGLTPGSDAPGFSLDSVNGGRVELGALLELTRPLLLLFTSPTCGPCSVLMPKVAEWQREYSDELTIALLSAGDADEVRTETSVHGLQNVLLDTDLAMYEAYQANGTPSAVLVAADGTITSWLAAGSDWIESLVEQTIHEAGATRLPIGAELPSARLAALDGTDVALADAVMGPTVLLFWNPNCGFCRSMHEEIRAWETDRRDGAPALVVVSAGEADDIRSEGFSSPVLLDPDWSLSSSLGADGTPMAVLVDAQQRIVSHVVAGGPAVLELLGAGTLSPV